MNLLSILWHYYRTKRLSFVSRDALEAYQHKQISRFIQRVLIKSPYFKPYLNKPFSQWPLMNKQIMMDHFDEMNTANLSLEKLLQCAKQSEISKDFTPKVGKYSVGLSSGTSGNRGLFVISPKEQQIWAGGILAKMLPKGLFAKERIALFLRSDNHLYHSVDSYWLSLRFFGLFENFHQQLEHLTQYRPTIVIAPAQVLSAIAKAQLEGRLNIHPYKVISAAEVLEEQDRQLIKQAFGNVCEVYQATEGFLASTCTQGILHLNEEFIHIEPKWLDENRFIPIITDFTRETQPIVRYQLDDILVRRITPCSCGRQGMAISHIEGRQDDQLVFIDQNGETLTIFADYRLIQKDHNHLQLIACCQLSELTLCQHELNKHFIAQGTNINQLIWQLNPVTIIPTEFMQKRRRIINQTITINKIGT